MTSLASRVHTPADSSTLAGSRRDTAGTITMMNEPAADEMIRAVTALIPFVRRWNLPLNPENLHELAYAVLLHTRSDGPLEEIVDAVEQQIDQCEEQAQHLEQAMTAALEHDD
jgi:hypothetical protein